jgi:hypothetical protein
MLTMQVKLIFVLKYFLYLGRRHPGLALLMIVGLVISLSLLIAAVAAERARIDTLGQVQHLPLADALAGPACDGRLLDSGPSVVSYLEDAWRKLSVTKNDDSTLPPDPAVARTNLRFARELLAPVLQNDPAWQEYDSSLAALAADITDDLAALKDETPRLRELQDRVAALIERPKQACEILYSDATVVRPSDVRAASDRASGLCIVNVVWGGLLVIALYKGVARNLPKNE